MSEKLVVIAGSDGDLGRSVASHFAKNGYSTIGLSKSGRYSDGLKKMYRLDLSDLSELRKTNEAIYRDFGDVQCVVNAAGSYKRVQAEGFDFEIHQNNFIVAENLLKVFAEQMKSTDGARIITIGSIDGLFPNVNSFAYSVSKAAIRTLVQMYKTTHRKNLVNFDLILPGGLNTRMRQDKIEDKKALIQPQEISRLCLSLATFGSNVTFDEIVLYPKHFAYSN